MLDVRANSIIYQSQVTLAKIVDNLITSNKIGKSKDPIWDKLLKIGEDLTALQYATRSSDTNSQSYILECLIVLTGINSFPSSPVLTLQPIPNILVGTQGATGQPGSTGPKGDTGQATDFLASLLTTTSTTDSFLLSASPGARWDYVVTDVSGAQRAGTVEASWSSTGAAIDLYDNAHPDIIGSTAGIEFNVILSGGSIVLRAIITSGNWTVRGSRYFIPNNGNGSGAVGSVLLNGFTYIGNAGNIATGVLLSGAVTVTNTGVTTLSNGIVTNANIVASAGLSLNKLAALTASRIVVTDGSGFLTTTNSPTLTELSYVGGATSNLQAQITAGLVPALTASRPVITNGSGVLAANPALSTNRVVKWNGTQFADSLITDDGVNVGISGNVTIVSAALNLNSNKITNLAVATVASDAVRFDQLTTPTISGTPTFLYKVLSIGVWNMNSSTSVLITHGIAISSKIRSVSIIIIPDDDAPSPAYRYDIVQGDAAVTSYTSAQGGWHILDNQIGIKRTAGGFFNTVNFDKTTGSFNRGYVTIFYEA